MHVFRGYDGPMIQFVAIFGRKARVSLLFTLTMTNFCNNLNTVEKAVKTEA